MPTTTIGRPSMRTTGPAVTLPYSSRTSRKRWKNSRAPGGSRRRTTYAHIRPSRASTVSLLRTSMCSTLLLTFRRSLISPIYDISVHSTNSEELCGEVDANLQDLHDLNVSRQLMPASVHGGTWKHFQEFEASFFDFYIFGLTCHIPRLLLDTQSSSVSSYLPFLGEALSCTYPAYLEFSTLVEDDCDGLGFLCRALSEMGPRARSHLKTLEVYSSFGGECDFAAVMEDFAIAIQETSIHDLILATSIDRSYLYRSFDSG
ncbi:hypothetical protein L226DRAFT_175000 [Lentinus tigrinus ALCF2SS1-7]|uniref:uncharacterized protein n=1 Tax=Lentinus tigrinus ALCF2SS1-7 TaxID=1328758 RepID=UPI0011663E66|nr:hypothetical protein L226DRAFT_175000 [Lentinus tigrinus ALCF2SS1-7]